MFKLLSAATLLAIAATSFAQTTTQPGQTTPAITPSQPPAVTPSQTPAVTPSQTPAVTPSQTPVIPSQTPSDAPLVGAPVVGGPAPAVGGIESRPIGGLSQCENMIGMDKEMCMQRERAGAGGTAR
jgi:hypothetical protein